MHRVRNHKPAMALAVLALAALGLAACSDGGNDGGASAPATATVAQRPSSPAKLSIVSPRNGQTVHQPRPALRLDLRAPRSSTRPPPASAATKVTSTCSSTASSSP